MSDPFNSSDSDSDSEVDYETKQNLILIGASVLQIAVHVLIMQEEHERDRAELERHKMQATTRERELRKAHQMDLAREFERGKEYERRQLAEGEQAREQHHEIKQEHQEESNQELLHQEGRRKLKRTFHRDSEGDDEDQGHEVVAKRRQLRGQPTRAVTRGMARRDALSTAAEDKRSAREE
jgi:hypothetical protein